MGKMDVSVTGIIIIISPINQAMAEKCAIQGIVSTLHFYTI